MFLVITMTFLILLSITLLMLWAHERITNKRIVPRAKIEEAWDGKERRRLVRFKKEIDVEYTVEKKPHIKKGKSIDISMGGMGLFLDEKLVAGTIIDLKLDIPGTKKIFEVEGEIVWTKDAEEKDSSGKRFFRAGMKYIAIKEPCGRHLSAYLASLES